MTDGMTTTQTGMPLWARWLVARWPAAAGIIVAVGTVLGISYGGQLAPVVAASGFVYLAAAAIGHRVAAWPAFGLTFVFVGIGFVIDGFNAVLWICGIAAALAIFGFIREGWRPAWSLPLQTAAMLVLAAAALLSLGSNHLIGGIIISAALFAHAGWDVWHHRTGRVVVPSLAEFCGVLDITAGIGVLVITLTM